MFDTTTVQLTHYVDVTVNCTITNTVPVYITEATTTTLHYTVSITDTDSVTVITTATNSTTVTDTETDSVTITNTDTDSVTVTNTGTDSVTITNTATVPATITTYTTRTIFSTTVDPCPKSCSMYVLPWPRLADLLLLIRDDQSKFCGNCQPILLANRQTPHIPLHLCAPRLGLYLVSCRCLRIYSIPSPPRHDHATNNESKTSTSPSVYMFVPSAQGINTLGSPAGPSTTSWMIPLDLHEVSTIAPGGPGPSGRGITRQLTLNDLGTDCPQTAEPTAIATMAADPRCNPVLAAPSQVRSWAYPCNACGRFGLFDPPYAVPTITGDLVEATPVTTVTATQVVPNPTTPAPTAAPVGVLVIEYYDSEGRMLSTDAVTVTGVSGTVTSSVVVPTAVTPPGTGVSSGSGAESLPPTTSDLFTESSATLPATSAPLVTASATRHGAGGGFGVWLVSSIVILLFWL